MPFHKSHLTAITRKELPVPTRWLIKNELVHPGRTVLDYGCGKCFLINPPRWDSYDPHYRPDGINKSIKYNKIICNYVLCTILSYFARLDILKDIQSHLNENGIAYITVRNDEPKSGWGLSTKRTYQCHLVAIPPLDEIHCCHNFRVFKLTSDMKLV